jgi:hypothetical protein
MEIDILVLLVMMWGMVLGWKRRGLTVLMDFMAISIVMTSLLSILPVTEGYTLSQAVHARLVEWVQKHLIMTSPESSVYFRIYQEIPVGTGMSKRSVEIADSLYTYGVTMLFGCVLFISIQMVRKAFLTAWTVHGGLWDSKLAGASIGGLLGVVLVFFITTVFGILSWFQGFEWLDRSLVQSVFVRTFSSYNPW